MYYLYIEVCLWQYCRDIPASHAQSGDHTWLSLGTRLTYSPLQHSETQNGHGSKSESGMVKVQVSIQTSRSKRDQQWPFRILLSTPMSISSLIFPGTGCISLQKPSYNFAKCPVSQRRAIHIYCESRSIWRLLWIFSRRESYIPTKEPDIFAKETVWALYLQRVALNLKVVFGLL